MFLVSLLRRAAARVRAWCRPSSQSPKAATVAVPKDQISILAPPKPRRRAKRHSPLWQAKYRDHHAGLWCGPTTVASILGVDVAEVNDAIKRLRGDEAPVEGTNAQELQVAFDGFGYEMVLVTNFYASPLPPTFAAWERAQTDMDAPFVLQVTGHWVAYRGGWACDTFSGGVPVKAKNAPGRRKRVRVVYQIYMAGAASDCRGSSCSH